MIALRRRLALVCMVFLLGACKGSKPEPPSAATSASAAPSSQASSSAVLLADGGPPPSIPNAETTVNQIRPAMRRCFAQMLQRHFDGTAKVTFAIEVGIDGKVTAVTPTKREGFDDTCIACMIEGAKTAQFERPLDNHPATVIAPFSFSSRRAADAPVVGGSLLAPPSVSK